MHETDQLFRRSRRFPPQTVLALFRFFICVCCHLWQPNFANSLAPDGITLLTIKSELKSDPQGLLSDWQDDGTDPCSWKGVGCDHLSRVVSLNITTSASCGRNNIAKEFCALRAAWSVRSPGIFRPRYDQFNGFSCRTSEKSCPPGPLKSGSTSLDSGAASIYNNTASCTLAGILSPAIGNLLHLRVLSIAFHSLSGTLPKQIAALRFLEVLDLRGNEFSGSIPPAFGRLSRLRTLNLADNSLEGAVPPELSGCHKLEIFNLAGNRLSGNIPVFIGSLSHLRVLGLSSNNLVGTIPSEVTTSCGNLEYFHVDNNFLLGTIPKGFGNCSRLKSLVVSSNLLSGPIPSDVGLLQLLQSLDVSRNRLSGVIPAQLGNCSQLSLLVLTNFVDMQSCGGYFAHENDSSGHYEKAEYNYFSTLASAVLNLPRLQFLWAPRAFSHGSLPSDWSTCQSLEVLNLAGNSITGIIPSGLVNCKRLTYLDLSVNKLEGIIPLPISCMVVFNVSGNALSGGLPGLSDINCPSSGLFNPQSFNGPATVWLDDASFYVGFVYLHFASLYCGSAVSSMPVWCMAQGMPIVHDLRENNISGSLPGLLVGRSLMAKALSYGLFVSGNQITGTIPSSLFESCQNFQALCINLSKNKFSGALPAEAMVNCISLRRFEAASNQLTGTIPNGLGNLHHMVYLDLAMNELSGELPSAVGQLQELRYVILANNSLTGTIPEDFGSLTSLVRLDLSGNKLTGEIPACLANLKELKELLLNNNYFSGNNPMNLANHNHVMAMDVAFENLAGSVPQLGNSPLHTTVHVTANDSSGAFSASVPKSSSRQWDVPMPYEEQIVVVKRRHLESSIVIAAITSGCVIAGVLIILIVLFHYTRQRVPVQPVYRSGRKELVTFRRTGVQLTYNNVVAATGNFSLNNLIGNGGFGATYKAEIIPGLLVAVKKLYLGRFQSCQQFEAEIRTLGSIHHPNLVTLIGYHASESQMFLIYNYLPGGNLENLIHDGSRGKISWRVRYKIALDVARALCYLHNECTPKVLHRDIKPSNVLLDNNLNAFLSDFGLARLLGASETHATTDVEGTFGYVAPEYAMTNRLSHKADVYSYGVVLLELLSGKRALDPSFSDCGNAVDIVNWACKLFETGKATEIFAPGLWEQGPHSELLSVLKLALKCTVVSLSERPTMKQVVDALISLR